MIKALLAMLLFVAANVQADYLVDGLDIVYKASAPAWVNKGSDESLGESLAVGDEIRFPATERLSVRGAGFKESFTPAEQVSNLNKLLGFTLPPSLRAKTVYYQFFNGTSPMCRVLIIEPGLSQQGAMPGPISRAMTSFKSNSVNYRIERNHLRLECQTNE